MGEFSGFGEDLRRDGCDVLWQVGFSGRGFGFIPLLPPSIQPNPPPESILALVESLEQQRQPAQEDEES
jgi:hypothetical protein